MRLVSVELERVRRFVNPLTLGDFGEGINLIYGPNETGKSTVQAAIGAAFLEKYSAQAPQQDLAPRDHPDARPRVRVTFSHDGETYELTKEFYRRGGTCVLRQGSTTLTGEEAVTRLVELFRFEAPSSRLISEAQLGLPGVFWVPQGSALGVEAALGHARGYLVREIGDEIGSARETAADEVIDRLRDRLAEVVTPTGRGGPLVQAQRDLAQREAELVDLEQRRQASQDLRDELEHIEADLANLESQQVDAHLNEEIVNGERRLGELRSASEARRQAESELARVEDRIKDLKEQVDRLEHALAQLDLKQSELERAQEALAECEVELTHHRRALVGLNAKAKAFEILQGMVRLEREHASNVESLERILAQESELRARINDVAELNGQIEHLKEQLSAAEVPSDEIVTELTELTERCRDLQSQLQAASTQVIVEIEEAGRLHIDGEAQLSSGSRLLEDEMTLEFPGVARISLIPQQRASTLRLALNEAEAELDHRLAALGVGDVGELRRRERDRYELVTELESRKRELARLVGDGDGPEAELGELTRQRAALTEREEVLASEKLLLAEELEQAPEAAKLSHEQAEQLPSEIASNEAIIVKLEEERRRLDSVRLTAQEARRWLIESIDRDGGAQGIEERRRTLDELESNRQRHQAMIATIAASMGGDDLTTIEAHIEELRARLARHLDGLRHTRERRGELIGQIRGDAFSEEEYAAQRLARDRAKTLVAALEERSQALKTLIGIAEGIVADVQGELTRPLKDRLASYANQLFAIPAIAADAASVELDETFTPRRLERAGVLEPVAQLSFGTREQMALLTRLGVADLMADRGVPVFLMLDDAMLNADGVRLARLKAILMTAARRYQIIIFTCRPELFSDLVVSQTIDLMAATRRS